MNDTASQFLWPTPPVYNKNIADCRLGSAGHGIGQAAGKTVAGAEAAAGAVLGAPAALGRAVASAAGRVVDEVEGAADAAVDAVKGTVKGAKDRVTDTAEDAADAVTDSVSANLVLSFASHVLVCIAASFSKHISLWNLSMHTGFKTQPEHSFCSHFWEVPGCLMSGQVLCQVPRELVCCI